MAVMAIIQARMSSSRLPGKVMMPIWGIPILLFMYNRVQESRLIDKLVVATSMDKTDNVIRELCRRHKILCFSGSLNDVLDRFYWLAQIFTPTHIVRLTADCPLIDPELIDATINYHIRGGYDYTCNYGYPDGLDVEVMTFETLCTAWKDSISPFDREHVCPYIRNRPDLFKLGRYENTTDLSHIKISVDTEDDYIKVKKIVEDSIRQAERLSH